MEFAHGVIIQAGTDVTGRADISLKTTPAAGTHDFWGGALRVSRDCAIAKGKGILRLEDGRLGNILVDSVRDEDENDSRLVTFLGYTPLERHAVHV